MDIKDIYPDLTADKNFTYSHELKTVADLINKMEGDGLVVGSSVDMSGSLVRVPVKATSTVRPDKGTEKSGWYFIYDNGNGNFFAQYGIGEREILINFRAQVLMIMILKNK